MMPKESDIHSLVGKVIQKKEHVDTTRVGAARGESHSIPQSHVQQRSNQGKEPMVSESTLPKSTPYAPICSCPLHDVRTGQKHFIPLAPESQSVPRKIKKLSKKHKDKGTREPIILRLPPKKLSAFRPDSLQASVTNERTEDTEILPRAQHDNDTRRSKSESPNIASPHSWINPSLQQRTAGKHAEVESAANSGTPTDASSFVQTNAARDTIHTSIQNSKERGLGSIEEKIGDSIQVDMRKRSVSAVDDNVGWSPQADVGYISFHHGSPSQATSQGLRDGTQTSMDPPRAPPSKEHVAEPIPSESKEPSIDHAEPEKGPDEMTRDSHATHEDSVFDFGPDGADSNRAESLEPWFGQFSRAESWPPFINDPRAAKVRADSDATARPTSSSLFGAFCEMGGTPIMSTASLAIGRNNVPSTPNQSGFAHVHWPNSAMNGIGVYPEQTDATTQHGNVTKDTKLVDCVDAASLSQKWQSPKPTKDSDEPALPTESTSSPVNLPPEPLQEPPGWNGAANVNTASKPQSMEPNTSTDAGCSKILNIELMTDESNIRKYIRVGTDISVEDLFLRVQKRMNRAVAKKEVEALRLRLPKHPTEIGTFLVESDDPDTWMNFLWRIGELEGADIHVAADVEV